MEIYLKGFQKTQVVKQKNIYLRDIAEIFSDTVSQGELECLIIFQIPRDGEESYLISLLDVVRILKKKYPDASVQIMGTEDILLEYLPKEKKEKTWLLWGKILFVCAVLFCGAATTIMCFHSDTQLPLIFRNYYYLFYGENSDLPMILILPYSIGLFVGILVFFNHFSKFALSKDPTPIEVEMTTYENETVTSMVEHLSQKKRKEKES